MNNNIQLSLFNENINKNDKIIPEIIKLPKIDLHRHLLGCVTLETFLKVSKKFSIKLPSQNISELREMLTITKPVNGLSELFKPWKYLSRLIINPEVIYILTVEALKDASNDNIQYVELRISWGITGKEKFSIDDFLTSLTEAINFAEKEYKIFCRVIFGITRHIIGVHKPWMQKKLLKNIIESCLKFKDICVVGFDLSGKEYNYPPSMFIDFFKTVKNEGFYASIHCGETTSTTDIWEAIIDLSADRIAHALSAIQDKKLLFHLRDNKIPLEICPTSNLLSSTVPSIEDHPLKILRDNNIRITINTDNPAIFGISLSKEYDILYKKLHFDLYDLKKITITAFETCFAPPNIKSQLKDIFRYKNFEGEFR